MRKGMTAIIAAAMFLAAGPTLAATDNGAKEIVIPCGNQGDVHFPHQLHQQTLKDCKLCHELYPEQPGAIHDLQQKGTLAKKQVMNQQCVKCHREKKEAGVKAGPVVCKECHVK